MAGIISSDQLTKRLGDPGLRILDMRGNFATYQASHIPGAEMLHIETLRLSDHGAPCQMMPTPMLGTIFSRLGIANDTPVVVYAHNPQDHMSASYCAWSLAVTGNTRCEILDGGYVKWMHERKPVTQDYPDIQYAKYTARFDDTLFADWKYIRDHLDNPEVVLVDTRTPMLYAGLSGTTKRRGHIPGAVLHNFLDDFAADGCYRPLRELRARYHDEGITPDKEIITYCVTGREGSAVWFMLKVLLGYPRVRLYQASMTEWAVHPELPMVTGTAPYGGKRPVAERRKAA